MSGIADDAATTTGSAWVALQHGTQKWLRGPLEIQRCAALPGTDVDWLSSPPWASLNKGAESTLSSLEAELSSIGEDVEAAESDLAAGIKSQEEGLSQVARERLLTIEQALEVYQPELLARDARRLLLRASGRCAALISRVRSLSSGASNEVLEQRCESAVNDASPEHAVLDLSKEQEEVTLCPHSVFVQGRSGTGKTLALVRRLLMRRGMAQKGVPPPTQLFVTKSSILRDEVASQLQYAGCGPGLGRLPCKAGDVTCVTWDQLVSLLVPRDELVGNGATVNFDHFLDCYWPHIQLPHLPAQLVWAEFTTRLRPFGSATKMSWAKQERGPTPEGEGGTLPVSTSSFAVASGLSLVDYLKDDLAAVGVRLTVPDQQRIHDMFVRYTKLKKARRELDDTDVAARVAREVGHVGVHARMVEDVADDTKRKKRRSETTCTSAPDNPDTDEDDTMHKNGAESSRSRANKSKKSRANTTNEDDTSHKVGADSRRSGPNKGKKSRANITNASLFSGVGELYIDEVQDFSPAELTVLFSLCHDPSGVAVAGDTCQTINPGSAFCFEDIYKAFCDLWSSGDDSETDTCAQSQRRKKGAKAERAERLKAARRACESRARNANRLTLRYNYRCAAGVANLAGSVTELLLTRFPRCADRIDEEVAMHRLVKLPVFAELPDRDPSTYFLGTGAQRVATVDPTRIAILVRTHAHRDALRASGVLGTILTVVEAKGLEFDLVVLVGFLSSAAPDSRIWTIADDDSEMTRVVRLIEDAQQLLYGRNSAARLTEKDRGILYRAVQAILELKMLYVAISRARAGFTVLECGRKADKTSPWSVLLTSWERRNLVEVWRGLESYTIGLRHSLEGTSQTNVTDGSCENSSESMGPRSEDKTHTDGSEENVALHEMLPALAPALEVRFCAENRAGGVMATAVQAQGIRLLRHAEDNPRDRWAVFNEAIASLSQAVVMVDQELFDQLMKLQQQAMLDEGLPPQSSNDIGVGSADSHPQPMKLNDSASGSLWTSKSLGWLSMQMCFVLQEASREPPAGGHPSIFRKLQRLAIWERIFSFLVPEDVADVHNTLSLVAEYVHEHGKVRFSLVEHISLARAWQTFSHAMFDADGRGQEHTLVDAAHAALSEECEERLAEAQDERLAMLDAQNASTSGTQQIGANVGLDKSLADFSRQSVRAAASHAQIPADVAEKTDDDSYVGDKGNLDELSRWLMRATEHLMELHPIVMERAVRCAQAGREFLAVRRAELAAKAFTEAAVACKLIKEVAKEHPPAGEELLAGDKPLAMAAREAELRASHFAELAAGCWILLLTTSSGLEVDCRVCWSQAQQLFASVDCPGEAAICAARAGGLRPKEVLDGFVGLTCLGMREKSLVWLCAALIGGL